MSPAPPDTHADPRHAATKIAASPSPRPPLRFDGRVVAVTGAGRGIGRAVAELLAARGARLVVHNRRAPDGTGDPAGELVAAIRSRGGEAVAETSDVTAPQAAERLVACALDAFGRLDAVVLNAGIIESRTVAESTEADLARLYEVNTLSAFRLTRAALPVMRRQGAGRLVYTTSTAGLYGGEGLAAYAMAKGALLGLMRAVAAEEAAHGVFANAVCPTAVTRMTEAFVGDPAMRATLAPELVAPAVAWLASEACDVQGRTILAAGGLFRSAHSLASRGVDLRALDGIGPEDVAAHRSAILEAEGLRGHDDAGSHFGALLEELARP
ncbi:MAG: SDR family NAD(P)-dependent oxidoreductase [Myxococcota bacterium]